MPEAKGLVERLHDYLERSFLPGRRFVSPQDFNSQLAGFSACRGPAGDAGVAAGSSRHRLETAAAVAPGSLCAVGRQRLSVHPAAIGRRVVVSADLDRILVTWSTCGCCSNVWGWVPEVEAGDESVKPYRFTRPPGSVH
jgi:hypothetical protein